MSRVLAPAGSKEYFYRTVATFAIVVLGAFAWYGLHRDIKSTANPCVTESPTAACIRYVCNIGDILSVKESATCQAYDQSKPKVHP